MSETTRDERMGDARALDALDRIHDWLAPGEVDLGRLVQSVTDTGTELTGARYGAFFHTVAGEGGPAYRLYALSGAPREQFVGVPRATELFGPTLRGEAPVRLADVRQDPRYGRLPPHHGPPPGHPPVVSYLAVPVRSRSGEVLGGLFFGHPDPGVFDERAERLACSLAAHAALAIDNARLYQALQSEQAALRRSEERLRTIFEQAAVGIGEASPEGRFLLINQRLCDLLGYERAELLELGWPGVTHPDDLAASRAKVETLRRGARDSVTFEQRYLRRDGAVVWARVTVAAIRDAEGALDRTVALVEDVTAGKAAEAQVAAEHAATELERSRLRAVLDILPIAVFLCDEGGRLLELNAAARRLWELPPEPAPPPAFGRTGQAWWPDGRPVEPAAWGLARALARGEVVLSEEVELQLPSGRRATILSYALPIRDPDGAIVGAVAVQVDITQRKRAMAELQSLNETLEQRIVDRTRSILQSQKQLRSLASELTLVEQRERRRLAGELHDYLAQLLVVARMKLSRALGKLEGEDRLLRELDEVLDESLRYTRTLIAELSPTILYEAGLPAAINWLAQQMKRHRLEVTVEQEPFPTQVPEDKAVLVYQSLRELLLNVVKHARVPACTLQVRCTPEELTVTVADRGVGMDWKARSERLVESGRYGLFSVRERLEAVGGRLELDAGPGQGTRATLRVPLQTTETTTITLPRVRKGRPGTARRPAVALERGDEDVVRVLLADDHALVREGIRSLIEGDERLAVVGEASDGEEAVALARSLRPDVIVMDVNMPGLNGIEATRRIRQEMPQTAVIGLSVHDDLEVAASMREAGVVAYLTKGGPSVELCRAIHEAVVPTG